VVDYGIRWNSRLGKERK